LHQNCAKRARFRPFPPLFSQVLILKSFKLFRMNTCSISMSVDSRGVALRCSGQARGRHTSAGAGVRRAAWRASMFGGAPSCGGQAASYGGQTEGECRFNYIIITHPGNLSIPIYKWFGYCGMAVCLAGGATKANSESTPSTRMSHLCRTKTAKVGHPDRLSELRLHQPTGCIGKLGGFDIPHHGPPALDGLSRSWDQQPNRKPSTRSDD